MKHDGQRARKTVGLGAYLGGERRRIIDAATPERLEQMHAAERTREVYRAWNAVCGGTREGGHVTGLRYLPESNKLLVYADAPGWTQELTMLREIIRIRMAREGVDLDGFVFRTSRPGYGGEAVQRKHRAQAASSAPPPRSAHRELSHEEAAALDAAVAPVEDKRLRDALKSAMRASLEWKKGQSAGN